MPKKKETTYRLKEETNAMAAAQIMLGLINNALGSLWLSLYNQEEKKHSIGSRLMLTSIVYLFVSGSFFINSGCSSITQGGSSIYQRVLAVTANASSIFMALFGILLFGYEFPIFESIGTEYIWSNMAGVMLLQISVICTISELVVAVIVLNWFVTSRKNKEPTEERVPHREPEPPPSKSASQHEMETICEDFENKDLENEDLENEDLENKDLENKDLENNENKT